jgi:hypothetical protein
MALGFSSGLLTGLQQYGQGGGIPADPRQRDAMQAAGVTNPLLQQFGRGLGGMLGTEMRSTAAIQQAQVSDRNQQARSILGETIAATPEKQLELSQQLLRIEGFEKQAIELATQAQEKIRQRSQETASIKSNEALATSLESLGEKQLANQVRAGNDTAIKEGIKIISEPTYSVTPKGDVVNRRTGEFASRSEPTAGLTENQKSALLKTANTLYEGENLDSVIANIEGGNITNAGDFKNYVKTLPSAPKGVDISANVEKKAMDYADRGAKSLLSLNNIDGIFSTAATQGIFDSSGGVIADAKKATLNFLGLRDTELKLRTSATKEINTEIINSLPAGVASDRDIDIFSRGFPPENATLEEVFEYLQAARKIHAAIADSSLMFDAHLQNQLSRGQSPTSIGFSQKQMNYNSAINLLRNSVTAATSQEERQNLVMQFSQAFGFVPTEFR